MKTLLAWLHLQDRKRVKLTQAASDPGANQNKRDSVVESLFLSGREDLRAVSDPGATR